MIGEIATDEPAGIAGNAGRLGGGEQQEPGILDASGGEHEPVRADRQVVPVERADLDRRAGRALQTGSRDRGVQHQVDVLRPLESLTIAMAEVLDLDVKDLIGEGGIPGQYPVWSEDTGPVLGVVVEGGKPADLVGPGIVGTKLVEAEGPAAGVAPVPRLEIERLQRTAPARPHGGRAAEGADAGIPQHGIRLADDLALEQALGLRLVHRSARLQQAHAQPRRLELQGERDARRAGAHDAEVVARRLVPESLLASRIMVRGPWVSIRGRITRRSLMAAAIRVNVARPGDTTGTRDRSSRLRRHREPQWGVVSAADAPRRGPPGPRRGRRAADRQRVHRPRRCARAGAFPPRAGDRAGSQPRPRRGPQSSHQGGGARPGPVDRQRRRAAARQRRNAGHGPRWPLQCDPGDGGGALRAGARHGPVCRRRAALPGHAGAAPCGYSRGAAGGRRARGGDGHHLLRDGGPGALRRPAVVRRAPLLLSGGP